MDIGGLQDAAKARREKLMAMRAKVFFGGSTKFGISTVFLEKRRRRENRRTCAEIEKLSTAR